MRDLVRLGQYNYNDHMSECSSIRRVHVGPTPLRGQRTNTKFPTCPGWSSLTVKSATNTQQILVIHFSIEVGEAHGRHHRQLDSSFGLSALREDS